MGKHIYMSDKNCTYPSDDEARKTILEVGKRMYDKGFVASNDGNITCKVSDDVIGLHRQESARDL